MVGKVSTLLVQDCRKHNFERGSTVTQPLQCSCKNANEPRLPNESPLLPSILLRWSEPDSIPVNQFKLSNGEKIQFTVKKNDLLVTP